jgi:uncharacterized membrane protein YhhN
MNTVFIWPALLLAILNWMAVAFDWRRVEYVAKPAVMVLLLVFIAVNVRAADPLESLRSGMIWFVFGLIFSLFGDVLLMLPQNRFLAGLGAFLLAQIFYTIGFNPVPPLHIQHGLAALLIAALAALPAAPLYVRIVAGLRASQRERLQRPILIYTIAICIMLFSALLTNLRGGWEPTQAMLVSFGAALFVLSDALLAWNRFVAPIRNGRLWNMITYQLAQFLIVLGASIQFLK